MYKHAIVSLVLIVFSNVTYAATDSWECALDLHQGDNGTLSFDRSDDNVEGIIRVDRNGTVFESNINGSWIRNEINLRRLIDSNSSEPMSGVVVSLGTKTIKIGGRYSSDFQGVWSADCDLVSEVIAAEEEGEVQPSTSSRVSPNNPSSNDRLQFSAVATHPDEIESISFFFGDTMIHSCDGSPCDFSYGPVSQGSYTWRVEAASKSGVKNSGVVNDLIVRNDAIVENCTISGVAAGFSAAQSPLFLVNLYGPNSVSEFRETKSFTNGRYEFSNLPAGSYVLTVDTRADEGVLATPTTTTVNCQSQSTIVQDFNFH